MESDERLDNSSLTRLEQVEFRPTELQLTDFANTAFCVFIFILSRLIVERRLEVTIPISMVCLSSHFMTDSHHFQVLENFDRSQKRDAVHSQRFHYRRDTKPLHLRVAVCVSLVTLELFRSLLKCVRRT